MEVVAPSKYVRQTDPQSAPQPANAGDLFLMTLQQTSARIQAETVKPGLGAPPARGEAKVTADRLDDSVRAAAQDRPAPAKDRPRETSTRQSADRDMAADKAEAAQDNAAATDIADVEKVNDQVEDETGLARPRADKETDKVDDETAEPVDLALLLPQTVIVAPPPSPLPAPVVAAAAQGAVLASPQQAQSLPPVQAGEAAAAQTGASQQAVAAPLDAQTLAAAAQASNAAENAQGPMKGQSEVAKQAADLAALAQGSDGKISVSVQLGGQAQTAAQASLPMNNATGIAAQALPDTGAAGTGTVAASAIPAEGMTGQPAGGSQTGGNPPGQNQGQQNVPAQAQAAAAKAAAAAQQMQPDAETAASFSEIANIQAQATAEPAEKTGSAAPAPSAVGGLAGGTAANAVQQAQRPAAPQMARALPPQNPAEQISVEINKAAKNGVDSITVHLKPRELGTVEVRLDIGQDGRMSAIITADNKETLAMLQKDAQGLEKALRDIGLQADAGSLSFNLSSEQRQQANAFRDQRSSYARNQSNIEAEQISDLAPLTASHDASARGVDISV